MKTTSKTFYHLIVAAVCVGLLSACAGGQVSLQPISHQPQIESFIISQADLEGREFLDADAGPRALVIQAVKAWRQNLYPQAGDFFLAAYRAGKDSGWMWKADAKIRLLDHSLRAFFLAGAVDKEIQIAKYLLSELTDKVVPCLKHLIMPKNSLKYMGIFQNWDFRNICKPYIKAAAG